jgi:hypothetical protein
MVQSKPLESKMTFSGVRYVAVRFVCEHVEAP